MKGGTEPLRGKMRNTYLIREDWRTKHAIVTCRQESYTERVLVALRVRAFYQTVIYIRFRRAQPE